VGSRHLFATEAAAWDCLGVREQAQQQEDRKSTAEAAEAGNGRVHPDRAAATGIHHGPAAYERH